jgi:hypothetical protein
MQQAPVQLQQVCPRGRHALTAPARRHGRLAEFFRQRALRKLRASLDAQVKASSAAFARGDMQNFYMFAAYARELAGQRDAVLTGNDIPIDATDFWLGVIALACLLYGCVFLYWLLTL